MRKLRISIGLALLLLFAQHGAVLHEVSHICSVGTNVHAQMHADSFLKNTCELCFAFSQVANPASNAVSGIELEPAACAATPCPTLEALPANLPTPRSRGPPSSTDTAA